MNDVGVPASTKYPSKTSPAIEPDSAISGKTSLSMLNFPVGRESRILLSTIEHPAFIRLENSVPLSGFS